MIERAATLIAVRSPPRTSALMRPCRASHFAAAARLLLLLLLLRAFVVIVGVVKPDNLRLEHRELTALEDVAVLSARAKSERQPVSPA